MRVTGKIFVLTTLCLGIALSPVISQDIVDKTSSQHPDIKIGSQEIPKAYWEGGDGDYNKVLDYLIAGYPGKVEVTFLPSSRLNRFLDSGLVDCSYISVTPNSETMEFIGPTNTISVTAYTRNGLKDIKKPDDLISIPFAIDVNLKSIARQHDLEPAMSLQSQTQMISLLAKGRIDALVGYDYDLDLLVSELNYTDQLKKTSIKFAEFEDGMTCHRTEKTQKFREIVKQNLIKARETGFLREIFDK
ncbi:ABC transporter substrate-binding protein [Kordiimonas sp. SCSIO 12610]|uniref:substrate-binding periplasmic protein n=1 Tax=Kordiimonas sp. SCSIO 12610 TaxID=2829597 RepID=UPI002109D2EC|nr:ABC transporter substrate-binding protein [Kordiimonas sp. SCSIO 12610]UTW55157.1 ABC transporter substrate-binding protein [Kordiimonas sp. SCSIO 12610]